MKLMITGAGGFVGSRLAEYYKNKRVDEGQSTEKYEVWGVRHEDLDVTDKQQVMEAVCSFAPDVLVHCGAISDVETCERSPKLSMAVNVEGTRYLARACAKAGAKFLFCSSDQVYFWQRNSLVPHPENEMLSPVPVYGQHKLLAESACLEEQPNSVILRLTWMYDVLSENEYAKGRRNLATMFTEALYGQGNAGGTENAALRFSENDYRGVTDVREVVRNMEKAWALPAGIYNYGSSNDTNMYETACRVLSAFGREALAQKAAGDKLRNLTMNTKKAATAGISFLSTADGLIAFLKEKGGTIYERKFT